jgi:uncharacterized protein YceH (UPF0502 family)
MQVLTPEQLRVVGSLIEKEATTPDQYPLTLNALVLACNQTSNRNPIVNWSPGEVSTIVGELRTLGLARVVHSPGQRADKYRQVMQEAWGLTGSEVAILGVLALRGPQTVNELQTRTERYGDMSDLGGVDGILHRLRNRYDESYVVRLERQPGQREERWAHLLAGEVLTVPEQVPGPSRAGSAERVGVLEAEIASLRQETAGLRAEVAALTASVAEVRQLLE